MSIELFKIVLTNMEDFEIEQNYIEILHIFTYIFQQADKFKVLPNPNFGQKLSWGVMEEVIPMISVSNWFF